MNYVIAFLKKNSNFYALYSSLKKRLENQEYWQLKEEYRKNIPAKLRKKHVLKKRDHQQ